MDIQERVHWIRNVVKEAGCTGIVYGNSGGKDCTLVGALCKMAVDNTMGVIMPCESSRNFGSDRDDALLAAKKFNIKTIQIDVTASKIAFIDAIQEVLEEVDDKHKKMVTMNINPRLRMITLYAVAAANNMLVAGTGNRSERTIGYFTKWGDGACDFNPIADLTVREVYQMLEELDCPKSIIEKAPSAGLFEGQTDELEMGISYKAIDDYLLNGEGTPENIEKIEKTFKRTAHKRVMPRLFKDI